MTHFTVEVTPVNDAPVIELPENMAFLVDDEDGLTIDFANFITDVDNTAAELI